MYAANNTTTRNIKLINLLSRYLYLKLYVRIKTGTTAKEQKYDISMNSLYSVSTIVFGSCMMSPLIHATKNWMIRTIQAITFINIFIFSITRCYCLSYVRQWYFKHLLYAHTLIALLLSAYEKTVDRRECGYGAGLWLPLQIGRLSHTL